MTPFEYSAFRNALGRSSGFQSLQYRMLEFMLGNKHAQLIEVHKRDPQGYAELQRALDGALAVRRGPASPEPPRLRNSAESTWRAISREPYVPSKQVAGAWLGVYHNAREGLGPV